MRSHSVKQRRCTGCRTPRSSHRRPDNPGTFRAPPSLNVGKLESSAATSNVKLMTTARTRHVDPEELHRSPAFTQGVIAPAARTLYVGGPARHR